MRSHCFALTWLAYGWRECIVVSRDIIWGQEKTSWGIIILATAVGDPCLFTGKDTFYWHLIVGRCWYQAQLVWEAGHQCVIDCWWVMSNSSAAANCFHASERARERRYGEHCSTLDRFGFFWFLHLLSVCWHNYPPQLRNLDGDMLVPIFIFISNPITVCGLS